MMWTNESSEYPLWIVDYFIFSRSLEATQKLKNITMKTMDSTITSKDKKDPGKLHNQVSSKVNSEEVFGTISCYAKFIF